MWFSGRALDSKQEGSLTHNSEHGASTVGYQISFWESENWVYVDETRVDN